MQFPKNAIDINDVQMISGVVCYAGRVRGGGSADDAEENTLFKQLCLDLSQVQKRKYHCTQSNGNGHDRFEKWTLVFSDRVNGKCNDEGQQPDEKSIEKRKSDRFHCRVIIQ
jgi:hypothetical protein